MPFHPAVRVAPDAETRARRAWVWTALVLVLLVIRLPSLVQPAGGDQGLYGYAGQRILASDVMYRDMWDQKPPAIAFTYAILWSLWPGEAVVAAADLAAAAAVAGLLVVLGRRRYSEGIGYGAAVLFLLLGDPYLQRLSGVYVRGQCEPFMALAVTAGLVLLAAPHRRRGHLVGAGVALAAAFWLKYNAAAYAIPVAIAAWAWHGQPIRDWASRLAPLAWVALGFAAVALGVLGYFALHGALYDLRLATLDYNLRYSNETYEGSRTILRYVGTLPFERARVDMLWFVGGLGTLLVLPRLGRDPGVWVVLAWLVAAVLSIAINGSRSLPNYFVQAHPALALAASAGLATLAVRGLLVRALVGVLLLLAVWRVGADAPVAGLRLASMPGLLENVRYDLAHLGGRTDRDAYLGRFRGQKHDAQENERLVQYIRTHTSPHDPIFVFGFSGGSVGWKSERVSASRFYWSRPVIIGFAADHPGYGTGGLLGDLRARPPAVVALQKDEWQSRAFFLADPDLRSWLESGYTLERETPMFSIWRRNDS